MSDWSMFLSHWGTYAEVGVKQPVNSFLGGKGLDIQQGTSVWVDYPNLYVDMCWKLERGLF